MEFIIRQFNPGQAKRVVGRATLDTGTGGAGILPNGLPPERYQEIVSVMRYLSEVPYAISADTVSGYQVEKVFVP